MVVKSDVSIWTFWRKISLEKFSVFRQIRTLSEKNSVLGIVFLAGLSKPFYLSGRSFCGKLFFQEKHFSMSFSKIEREISGCLSENFWRVCENWIPLVHRNILVENCFASFLAFWDKEEKDPDLVAKNFCRFVEIAFYILRVHRNILLKTFF